MLPMTGHGRESRPTSPVGATREAALLPGPTDVCRVTKSRRFHVPKGRHHRPREVTEILPGPKRCVRQQCGLPRRQEERNALRHVGREEEHHGPWDVGPASLCNAYIPLDLIHPHTIYRIILNYTC